MSTDRPDPSRPEDPDHGLDVDAAFAEIVAQWGPAPESAPEEVLREDPPEPAVTRLDRGSEPAEDAEEHFVPPPPPPLPTVEPRRRLAWAGLLGTPIAALLMVVLDVRLSGLLALLMVAAFVGGFGYLVATMGSGPRDPWDGDDGAVV